MRQHGRKSEASLAVTVGRRLRPPATLTEAQRSVWLEAVNSRPADWFGPQLLPLLEAYCRHAVYGRQIAAELDKVEPESLALDDGLRRHETLLRIHEKESRAMSALATRLRLTNQSLQDKKTAGRASDRFTTEEKPWEMLEAA